MRVNVTGMQGNRLYLAARGVTFEVHNPTIDEVHARITELRSHPRHAGHRGHLEAADLLESLIS